MECAAGAGAVLCRGVQVRLDCLSLLKQNVGDIGYTDAANSVDRTDQRVAGAVAEMNLAADAAIIHNQLAVKIPLPKIRQVALNFQIHQIPPYCSRIAAARVVQSTIPAQP